MRIFVGISIAVLLTVFGCKNKVEVENQPVVQVRASDEMKQDRTDTSFEDLQGNPITLSDYKGKKVLLNYWATWCRPCIEEMPALLDAQEILKNENYIFLLASDQSMDKIKAFVAKRKLDFEFIRFKGSLAEIGINALPTTFLYDEEGEQVLKIVGQTDWNSQEVIERLKNAQ